MARATFSPAESAPRTDISDAVDAALHRVAQRIEDAAADILAHPAGIGGAGHERSGHLAAPVDMGAADGKQFWALHAVVILRLRDHGATIGGPAPRRQRGPAESAASTVSARVRGGCRYGFQGMHPKAARRNKNGTNSDYSLQNR